MCVLFTLFRSEPCGSGAQKSASFKCRKSASVHALAFQHCITPQHADESALPAGPPGRRSRLASRKVQPPCSGVGDARLSNSSMQMLGGKSLDSKGSCTHAPPHQRPATAAQNVDASFLRCPCARRDTGNRAGYRQAPTRRQGQARRCRNVLATLDRHADGGRQISLRTAHQLHAPCTLHCLSPRSRSLLCTGVSHPVRAPIACGSLLRRD